MTEIECVSCEGAIEPGQGRKPTDEGTKHDYCVLHDSLFDKYRFYITNPRHAEGSGVSFWRVYEDESEFPVFTKSDSYLVNSSSQYYSGSDGISPTENFFKVVAYSIHDFLAFTGGLPMPGKDLETQIEESFERTADVFYKDTKMPKHEVEVGKAMVTQIIPQSFPYVIAELGPVRDFADECTKFDLPEVHPALET